MSGGAAGPEGEFGGRGAGMDEAIEFIGSCTTLSELIDKLCIENVRLWHILDDTVDLKRQLEAAGPSGESRNEILEKIAKKSFENIETVRRRSAFKKAIDEVFGHNVRRIVGGLDSNVCVESKSYGRDPGPPSEQSG